MTLSISIDPTNPHGSDSSLTDEEDSSVVQVSVPSDGSHEYQDYDEWAHLSYPDELKPSDSASRPRTSHRNRSLHGSRSASGRRQPSRRQMISERESLGSRARRHRSPESPDSADSEEYPEAYARNPHDRRWPPAPPAAGYAPSASSGPSFNAYPPGHAPYPHPNGALPSDQLIRFGHANPVGQPYGPGPYPYGAQGPSSGAPMYPPFYAQDQAHRHPRQPPQSRIDPHNPAQPPLHPMGAHGPSPYASSPFHHEMMPYAPNAYYNYRDPYSMAQGMMPQSYFPSYPQVPSPTHPEAASSPAPPPADAAKDEAIARLEKLILDERTERESKEAARLAAIEREAAEAAAKAQQLAHDRKIAEEAALLARADAEKKAADDAAKAKEEAEKAAAAAASEAAAAATAAAADAATAAAAEASSKPAPEKKKPIKFKDAVGRKFSFPFELCSTWQGMEDLIKQAFLHIEVIGPHVAEGHYDLVGPNGDIILPQVWETVVEPDWTITMHMWPIPEKPKEADPSPTADPLPAKSDAAPAASEKKKDGGSKKPKAKGATPMAGGFANWMMGGRNPPRVNKAPKAEKKAEPAAQ